MMHQELLADQELLPFQCAVLLICDDDMRKEEQQLTELLRAENVVVVTVQDVIRLLQPGLPPLAVLEQIVGVAQCYVIIPSEGLMHGQYQLLCGACLGENVRSGKPILSALFRPGGTESRFLDLFAYIPFYSTAITDPDELS